MPTMEDDQSSNRYYSGRCPDARCQTKLMFRASGESSIECTNCGQRNEVASLREVTQVTDIHSMLHNLLKNILLAKSAKRGAEAVKVMGLSNYHCKILSPLLTRYGMDKKTGKAVLLGQLNQGENFDCSVLGNRCFLIDREHMELVGYGRDISGSQHYLADTLETVLMYNDQEERLLPVHADGDGHCLVHAVSRALVGRELFWHPLRTNLKSHLLANLDRYKEIFRDFIDQSEWKIIVEECNPEFEPPDGEILGLRNIHVFGLANVLRRPIILLDSLSGMQSPGDYSATFLPALAKRSECMGKNGELNKPLCIAWSSSGRNHYIPLVGIKNGPLPRLPRSLVPKAWGLPQDLLNTYIEFDRDGYCIIGGDQCIQDSYILRLASAMEEVFMSEYSVHPGLVADVHHYIFKRTGVVGVTFKDVLQLTQKAVREQKLFVCLLCGAVCEQKFVTENFKRGGSLYNLAEQIHGKLRADKVYPFPVQGVVCTYNAETDELIPTGRENVVEKCNWCPSNQVRRVNADSSIQYNNGDQTKTRSSSVRCKCGFKHWWNSVEYDSQPSQIPVVLEWAGKVIKEKVLWFQHESDPKLNSNVYTEASNLVSRHFPGVFGSERLVQKVVDQILEQTKKPEEILPEVPQDDEQQSSSGFTDSTPDKIILSGFGTIHKEELTMSETERLVRQKITDHAPLQQRRPKQSVATGGSSSSDTGARKLPPKTSRLSDNPELQQTPTSPESVTVKRGPQANARMVRVVTSNGRQLRIVLEEDTTCATFLVKLEMELGIQPSRIKRILYGFPPRELVVSNSGDSSNSSLPFEAGDKVSVEIMAEKLEQDLDVSSLPSNMSMTRDSRQKGTDILRKLQDFQNSNVDNVDASITALVLTASLLNHDLWTYVQRLPHLFAAGGLFYRQVKRDVDLVNCKHYRLAVLPNQLFRYSSRNDRLELCLEPAGHFGVVSGVEELVASGQLGPDSHCQHDHQRRTDSELAPKDDSAAGSSGVIISRSQQKLSSRVPFCGKGYSLTPTSQEGATTSQRGGDQQNNTLSFSTLINEGMRVKVDDGSHKPEELMETDEVVGPQQASDSFSMPSETVRRGPGFSVLNPELVNRSNSQAEFLRQLVSQLTAESPFGHSQQEPDSPSDSSSP